MCVCEIRPSSHKGRGQALGRSPRPRLVRGSPRGLLCYRQCRGTCWLPRPPLPRGHVSFGLWVCPSWSDLVRVPHCRRDSTVALLQLYTSGPFVAERTACPGPMKEQPCRIGPAFLQPSILSPAGASSKGLKVL